jgi:hypothetical protein
MAFASVQFGLYYGFSLAEMQAELARYKAAVQAMTPGAGHVTSASVNGSSFTYGPNADLSLAAWQAEIQNALADVDDNVIGLPSETVACFNR